MDQEEHSLLLSVPSTDLMLRSSIVMCPLYIQESELPLLKKPPNSNFMFYVYNKVGRLSTDICICIWYTCSLL